VLAAENLGQNRVNHRGLARFGEDSKSSSKASVYNAQSSRKIPSAAGGRHAPEGEGRGTYEAPAAVSSRM
jgi:hypothetical protein